MQPSETGNPNAVGKRQVSDVSDVWAVNDCLVIDGLDQARSYGLIVGSDFPVQETGAFRPNVVPNNRNLFEEEYQGTLRGEHPSKIRRQFEPATHHARDCGIII